MPASTNLSNNFIREDTMHDFEEGSLNLLKEAKSNHPPWSADELGNRGAFKILCNIITKIQRRIAVNDKLGNVFFPLILWYIQGVWSVFQLFESTDLWSQFLTQNAKIYSLKNKVFLQGVEGVGPWFMEIRGLNYCTCSLIITFLFFITFDLTDYRIESVIIQAFEVIG